MATFEQVSQCYTAPAMGHRPSRPAGAHHHAPAFIYYGSFLVAFIGHHTAQSRDAAPRVYSVQAGLLSSRVHFIKGFFEDTVPAFGTPTHPLALLRSVASK